MIRVNLLLTVIVLVAQTCSSKKVDENAVQESNNPITSSGVAKADTSLMKTHLIALTQTKAFRKHSNLDQLNETAEYIRATFARHSTKVSFQEFSVAGNIYKNVIASFGPADSARIIIGGHYDVCGEQSGADDNASGVTGLLELARMLHGKELKHRIDLVAYSLEEPPYFRSEFMGSFIHAESLHKEGARVYGMISLEMIGYFSDEPDSQRYPDGIPPGYFGTKGDYIALVMKTGGGQFTKNFSAAFAAAKTVKSNPYTAPTYLTGIDFSDHLNYWIFNYDAMMITDTSFYRNPNYHKEGDTLETLDLKRMAGVIDGIYKALFTI